MEFDLAKRENNWSNNIYNAGQTGNGKFSQSLQTVRYLKISGKTNML